MNFRNGRNSLLRPEDSVLVLIDHQPSQLSNLLTSLMTGSGIVYLWEHQLLNTPETNAPAGL